MSGDLKFEVWGFSGAWMLEFEASNSVFDQPKIK
jgi:hypothetical protein